MIHPLTKSDYKKHLVNIKWGIHKFNSLNLVIVTAGNYIIDLALFSDDELATGSTNLIAKYLNASQNQAVTLLFYNKIIAGLPIDLLVCGTELQIKVWQELLNIQPGTAISYQELAARVDKPKAVRAVASAVAANIICLLIPCHRVVRKSGDIGQFRYGASIKKTLLKLENYA